MADRRLTEARTHIAAGRWPEAIMALTRAVDGPAGQEALLLLANVFRQLDRPDDAVRALETALGRNPADAEAKFQLANLAAEMGAVEGAEQIYRELLSADPASLPVRNNLANLLRGVHRPGEALVILDEARAAVQGNADALSTYGLCAMDCGDLAGAREAFERALAQEPGHGEAPANLGEVLLLMGERGAGMAALAAARDGLGPTAQAQIDVNLAFAHFLDGAYGPGWQAYESRFGALPPTERPARPFPQPRWRGETLEGTLLAWGEQGVGDEIIYAGMLADALQRMPRIVLECEPRLAPLFARSYPAMEVVARSDPPAARLAAPDIVAQIPLASLGGLFRNDRAAFPARHAYLKADPGLQADLRARYRTFGEGPLVGLSWRSVNARAGPAKSMALGDLAGLASVRPAVFVSLQYGDVDAEVAGLQAEHGFRLVQDPAIDQMRDMDAFAAQVAAMDLVISVSNTAAHVAGALGRPVWAMVPAGAGLRWYWGREGRSTPWYPSMRLYRQAAPGRWRDVIDAEIAAFGDLP